MKPLVLLSLAILGTAGCGLDLSGLGPRATDEGARTFTPIPTLTSGPVARATSVNTPLPVATLTSIPPPPYVSFEVSTLADNVALRKGPGYLFARIGLLPEGTKVRVLARSHGGEWAMVQTTDERVGWVFIQLTEASGGNWGSVPFSEPLGAQLITGLVKDEAGVPISGVQFALTQGDGALAPRTDALTDETGTFFAYMPLSATGSWNLSYTAIACTSNTMDSGCNPKNGVGGRPYPDQQYITLPLTTSMPLQFLWK